MAFWGAPLKVKNQEIQACEAILLANQVLLELDEKRSERPPFRTRFGIDCGDVVVGNIGSHNRFNYTIIGDHVNITARLEEINKVYGTSIIISSNVYEKVKDIMVTRKLDYIRLKGKKLPTLIYELVGRKDDVDESTLLLIELYEKAFLFYVERKFREAQELFKSGKERYPQSKSFSEMELRCIEFIDNPPPKEWKGEWLSSISTR